MYRLNVCAVRKWFQQADAMNSESVKDEEVFPQSPCKEDEEMCSGAVDDGQNA